MRDHALRNCVACNKRCDAWLCLTCSLSSDVNSARQNANTRSPTATSLGAALGLRLGNDVAYEHLIALQLAAPGSRTVHLRIKHSDVHLTQNERRSVRGLYSSGQQRSRAYLRAHRDRWTAFAALWPRIGLAHLEQLVAPVRERRIVLPSAIGDMP